MRRASLDDRLRCSFCHKDERNVGKLISSPSDSRRVYICDECIAVCAAIIEDDQADSQKPEDMPSENVPHPLLNHPLASTLMEAVESWIREESLGKDGVIALRDLRAVANQMVSQAVAAPTHRKT